MLKAQNRPTHTDERRPPVKTLLQRDKNKKMKTERNESEGEEAARRNRGR